MTAMLRRFAADETAATSIEYALIGALVSVAIILGATAVGVNLSAMYNNLQSKVPAG